jgi:hypothetical protein
MADDNPFDLAPVEPKAQPPAKAPGSLFDLAPAGDTTPAQEPKILSNAPDETFLSGTAKNFAGNVIGRGVTHIPGMAGDITDLGLRVGASALSHMPWEDRSREAIEQGWRTAIATNTAARRADLEKQLAQPNLSDYDRNVIKRHLDRISANPEGTPPTGEQIYQSTVAPKFGEYTPTTMPGRFGRAIGETVIPALMTPGLGPVKALTSGTTAGLAGQTASELGVTDPLALAGISLVGAGVPSALGPATRPIVAPIKSIIKPEIEKNAATGFASNFADPEAALEKLKTTPQGELSTPAEITQDPLFANVQDAARTDPRIKQELQSRVEIPRNQQRQTMLAGTAPIDATPEAVSTGFQKHYDDITAARQALEPAEAPPSHETGEALAGTVAERAQNDPNIGRVAIDNLKKSIDPNNTMKMWTGDIVDHATGKVNEIGLGDAEATRPHMAHSPISDPLLQEAAGLGNVTKFGDLVDFDQKVSAALKQARNPLSSDNTAVRELTLLKGKIKDAINNALENQHKTEQGLVGRGELHPDETVAWGLALSQQAAEHMQRQRAAASGVPESIARSAGPDVGGGPSGVRPVQGGSTAPAGSAGAAEPGRPTDAGSISDVPGAEPALSADEAARRLNEFNQRWGEHQDTFKAGNVGKAITPKFGGQPGMTGSQVAADAFKNYDNTKAWITAGGPEGLDHVKNLATADLQKATVNKPLDQAALDKWRTKNADALKAISEHDPDFADSFNDAAAAQGRVQQFEKSAAAKFLGLDTPDSITGQVGQYMGQRVGGPEKITALMEQAKNADGVENGPIQAGIRRAGADWLKNKFDLQAEYPDPNGGSVNVLGNGLKKFIDQHQNMLEALFDPAAFKTMNQLADSFGKSISLETLQRTAGSPTAQRQSALLRAQLAAAEAHDLKHGNMNMGTVMNMAAMGEFMHEGISPGSIATAGKLYAARKAFEFMQDAIEKKLGANKSKITSMMAEGFYDRNKAEALLQRAVDSQGNPNPSAFNNLYRAFVGAEATEQQEERQGRAFGGAVAAHASAAKHLISLVDKARRMDTERTKPLLKVPDHAVATALAAANKSI